MAAKWRGDELTNRQAITREAFRQDAIARDAGGTSQPAAPAPEPIVVGGGPIE
jgi:hypothetical protein